MKTKDLLNKINGNIPLFMSVVLKQKVFSETTCTCPFHHSKDGDFSFNEKTGLWKCFGKCDKTFGDSIHVSVLVRHDLTTETYKTLSSDTKKKLFSEEIRFLSDVFDGQTSDVRPEKTVIETCQTDVDDSLSQDDKTTVYFMPVVRLLKAKWQELEYEAIKKAFAKKAEIKRFEDLGTHNQVDYFNQTDFIKIGTKNYKIVDFDDFKFLKNYYGYGIFSYKPAGNSLLKLELSGIQFRRKDDSKLSYPKAYNLKNFQKSSCIYGLVENIIPKIIEKGDSPLFPKEKNVMNCLPNLTIVEGPADVIKSSFAGIQNPVSLLGKSISKAQIELLKYYLKNQDSKILVFLDNDEAGITASKKMVKTLKEAGFKNVYTTRLSTSKDCGEASVDEIKTAIRHNKREE